MLCIKITLFVLILVILGNTVSEIIHCGKDVITFKQLFFIPTQEKNVNFIKVIGNQSIQQNISKRLIPTSQSKLMEVEKLNENGKFLLELKEIMFLVQDDTLDQLEFQTIKKSYIQLMSCDNIHYVLIFFVHSDFNNAVLICNFENSYYFYWFSMQENKEGNQKFNSEIIQKINIIPNCIQKSINYGDSQDKLFAQLNCTEWEVYTLSLKELKPLADSSQFNYQILRNIYADQQQVYFIFDHQVFKKTIIGFELIFQNNQTDNLILQCIKIESIDVIVLLEEENEDQQNRKQSIFKDQLIYIYLKYQPKDILVINHILVIIIEKSILVYENFEIYQKFNLEINSIFYGYKSLPFFYGMNENQLFLLQFSSHSPYFQCNDYVNNSIIQFTKTNFFEMESEIAELLFDLNNGTIQNNNTTQLKFNQTVYIYQQQFSFFIENELFFTNGIQGKIQFLPQQQIPCFQQNGQIIQICQMDHIKQSLWFHIHFYNKIFFLIYQNAMLEIIILNCSNNKINNFGKYEQITKTKVQIYQLQVHLIIVYKEGRNIYIINFISQPQLSLQNLAFDQKIVNIQAISKSLFVIFFSNCQAIYVQNLNIQNYSFQKFNLNHIQNCQIIQKVLYSPYLLIILQRKIYFSHPTYTIVSEFISGSIISLFQLQKLNDLILLIEENGEVNFYKYAIFYFQLIKLFKFQQANFRLVLPVNYVENQKFLVALAQTTKQPNMNVLLVYYLEKNFDEILFQIIENVDAENFNLVSEDILTYQQHNKIFYIKFDETKIQCELQDLSLIKKEIQFSLEIYQNFKDISIGTISIKFENRIPQLISKRKNIITFQYNNEGIYKLDLRPYLIGQITSIKSENFDIQLPLSVKQVLSTSQCPQFQKLLCVNFNDNYLITNINIMKKQFFNFSKNDQLGQISQDSFYVASFHLQEDKHIIKIYSFQSVLKNEIHLISPQSLLTIHTTKNHIIIVFQQDIFVYKSSDTSNFLIQHNFACQSCQIKSADQTSESVLLYSPIFEENFLYFHSNEQENQINFYELEILDSQGIQVKNIPQIEFSDIYENDTYIIVRVIMNQLQNDLQIFEGLISKRSFDYMQLIELKIYLRNFFNNSYYYFQSISSQLLFISNNQKLNLYNMSEYTEFDTLDPIFQIDVEGKTVQVINDSHLLVSSLLNNTPHQILEISSYKLSVRNNSIIENQLIAYNDVSEVLFIIELFSNQKNDNLKTNLILIFSFLLLILVIFGLYYRRRKILKRKVIQNIAFSPFQTQNQIKLDN